MSFIRFKIFPNHRMLNSQTNMIESSTQSSCGKQGDLNLNLIITVLRKID